MARNVTRVILCHICIKNFPKLRAEKSLPGVLKSQNYELIYVYFISRFEYLSSASDTSQLVGQLKSGFAKSCHPPSTPHPSHPDSSSGQDRGTDFQTTIQHITFHILARRRKLKREDPLA